MASKLFPKWMFRLRGDLTKSQSLVLSIIGAAIFLGIWIILTMGANPILKPATLPSPMRVLTSYSDLLKDNDLVQNTFKSIGLNLSGYVIALLISLPLGFLIGLTPFVRGLFQKTVEAVRFVPLTATVGLFIVWFGIGTSMKSIFMAFGILIFFLPVVVQRINEVEDVYLKTVYTLGATSWQTIRTVYIPSVLSRLWDDIRIMTAISWTYIIFVEAIGSEGGLGYLTLFGARRQGRIDKVFALLILIIVIGILQDRIFARLDKKIFPHKYQTKGKYEAHDQSSFASIKNTIFDYTWTAFTWIALLLYVIAALDEVFGVMGHINILSFLFGGTVWVIHFIFLLIIGYKLYSLTNKKSAQDGRVSVS